MNSLIEKVYRITFIILDVTDGDHILPISLHDCGSCIGEAIGKLIVDNPTREYIVMRSIAAHCGDMMLTNDDAFDAPHTSNN
jgi:hypothetical protein